MTSSPEFNLLQEPLLHVERAGRPSTAALTVSEVLHELGDGDELLSFTHLQSHQNQAWYCFLCQLASIALARFGVDRPEQPAERWTELLLDLSEGAHEPWCLFVPDLSRPAFFQAPVPEDDWSALDKECEQPDDLDLLVTSVNHDVKLTRIARSAPAHWIYALVSLQTTANFTGRGNYGVARKSSGYSCRPFVGLTPGLGWGERFRRDVQVLLAARAATAEEFGYDADEGLPLTFLRPWDGSDSIHLGELDPYFIEDCRRVRLQPTSHGGLRARRTGTETRRIAAKELEGNVGDPWTPIRRSDGTALNVSGRGFHYELVTDLLLTGEYSRGAAAKVRTGDPEELFLICQALSRGQGQTNGLHERIIPIPSQVRRRLMESESRKQLGERAQDRIEFVDTVHSKALRPALCALHQGDPETLDFEDDRPRRWIQRHEERVDRIFFTRLWQHADLLAEDATLEWRREVLGIAADVLEEAIDRAPVPEPRRYRGWAGAERIFNGVKRRLLGAAAAH